MHKSEQSASLRVKLALVAVTLLVSAGCHYGPGVTHGNSRNAEGTDNGFDIGFEKSDNRD